MNRIEALASLVDKDASLLDIGTDHAYLPIYLYKNNITKNVVGSDISSQVLKYAKNNLKKFALEDKIKLILSDGFKNIQEKYDIAVISGVGTKTIEKILDSDIVPNKLIISSHKNVPDLREFMQKINYKIKKEIVIIEKNIYYNIIKYEKGKEVLNNFDILVGKSNNEEYRKYILEKYKLIYAKSKNEKYLKYIEIIEKTQDLKNL